MAKVTVFQWAIYDIQNDAMRKSRRYATREAIEWAHGTPLEQTAVEIDEAALGAEVEGMTPRDFDPHATMGFQRQVRS